MNKILQKLLFIEKFEIKTKLSKERVQRILEFETRQNYDYRAYFSKKGFCVAEKTRKHSGFVRTNNSFAPVATAKASEQDGMTVISVLIRMNFLICLIWYPLYLLSVLSLVAAVVGLIVGDAELAIGIPVFLFCFGLPFFAFRRPAKRLKAFLENLLVYE
ncbi:MAG: hypothetical protein IJW49_02080 [Clostridia bacterium]|nr:hypothetical protein [Clostridia bacterium]